MGRIFLLLVLVVLFSGLVFAQPLPPEGLRAEFDPNGILITWQHSGGLGTSFNVYRGHTADSTSLLANTLEKNYLDRSVEPGKEYWYYITAVDSSGESIAVKFNVTNIGQKEKPFTITLVDPTETTFTFEETVEFIVEIESEKMSELTNVTASIASTELGLGKEMDFDSLKNRFFTVVEMPSAGAQGLSAEVKILVKASFEGEDFSESQVHTVTLVPERGVDTIQLALNFFMFFAPIFVLFALIGAAVVVWGSWSARIKAEKDRLREQLLEVQKEQLVWKHEAFKRRITPEQFREKSGELQGKQAAIEEKLGAKPEKGQKKRNLFEGFSPMEAQEVMVLVKSIGKPKKGETRDSLRARLVGLGKSEKIAKKATSIVFDEL